MLISFHTLLCDGDIVLHRACAIATHSVEFDGEVTATLDLRRAGAWIRDHLRELKDRFSASRVLIALGDRKANFRKELSADYKANRKGPKPVGFLQLEERLRAHAKVISEPRLEGDDVLGLMATKEPTEGKLIISVDKDLLQIPGWHYNPDTEDLREVNAWESARRHAMQTLTGDRVDNYPGCPGLGPVRARRILEAVEDPGVWPAIVEAYRKAGQTEEQALLQARLAFVLRQGFWNRKTKEITLWTPPEA